MDPGFEAILAFDYYDGPEHGLALYPSGDAVRFASAGDSESRMLRAFVLNPIEGNWWPRLRALQKSEGVDPPRRILLPARGSETLYQVESDATQAVALSQFIAVGSADLGQLSVCQMTPSEADELHKLGCSPEGFAFAQLLLGRRNAAR
jgi:hypothetical protein